MKSNKKNNGTFALRQALDVLDVQGLSRCEGLSRAKVYNLQVVTIIHQHVVRLQIQVDDSTAVKVVDCAQNLDQQLCDLSLCIQISERTGRQTGMFVKLDYSI